MLLASRAFAWHSNIMARETTEPWVQLATRVPKPLHRDLKLHCVQAETSVMAFVVAALKEKLVRQRGSGRRARDRRTG
jgi:predicted HicB family RNase H-like nuclease